MTTDLRSWRCWHCDSTNVMLAGSPDREGKSRQVLGVTHELGCPDYVDVESMPAAEFEYDHDTGEVGRLGSETDGLD